MSHFRTSRVPYRLVPQVRRIWVYKQVNRPSCMCRYLSRFVAVCVWKVVMCYFGRRRIHNFRLEVVFGRGGKTNRPISREQILSPGKLLSSGLGGVPWLVAGRGPYSDKKGRYGLSRRQNIHNKTRVSSRGVGWLVWFSRLKMSYWRKLWTFW